MAVQLDIEDSVVTLDQNILETFIQRHASKTCMGYEESIFFCNCIKKKLLNSLNQSDLLLNFHKKILHDLDLSGVSLSYAKFQGAHLKKVDFSDTNLTGANFSDAILENVIINENTCFDKANFKDATLIGESLAEFRKKLLFETKYAYLGAAEAQLFDIKIPEKIQLASKDADGQLNYEWIRHQEIEKLISQARDCPFTLMEDLKVSHLYKMLYKADEVEYEKDKKAIQTAVDALYSSIAVIDLGKPPGLGLIATKQIAKETILGIYAGVVVPNKGQPKNCYVYNFWSESKFATHIIDAQQKGSILSLINYAPRLCDRDELLQQIDFLPNDVPLASNVQSVKLENKVNIWATLKTIENIMPGCLLLWAYVRQKYAEGHAGGEICFFSKDKQAGIIYPVDYLKSLQGVAYSGIVLAVVDNAPLKIGEKIIDINQCEQIIADLEITPLRKLSEVLVVREKWHRENEQYTQATRYSQAIVYVSKYLAKG